MPPTPEEEAAAKAAADAAAKEAADKVAADKAAEDALGDAGKKALQAERDARAKAEKDAKDAKTELDKLRKDSMSDQERAVAEAKESGRAEAHKENLGLRIRDRVTALAAGKVADASDAIALLGELDRFANDKGEIDDKAITSAIEGLVKSKPYLASAPGSGSGEGGPRGATPKGDRDSTDPQKLAAGVPRRF